LGPRSRKGFVQHGYSVVIGDIDGAGAKSHAEASAPPLSACASMSVDRDSVDEVVATIVQKHGGLDVLVNNAGVLCVGAFDATSSTEWQTLLNVNLTGLFHCAQAHTVDEGQAQREHHQYRFNLG